VEYFKALSQYSSGQSEKNLYHENLSRISDPTEILTGLLSNMLTRLEQCFPNRVPRDPEVPRSESECSAWDFNYNMEDNDLIIIIIIIIDCT
jgi:hypothetical protein